MSILRAKITTMIEKIKYQADTDQRYVPMAQEFELPLHLKFT